MLEKVLEAPKNHQARWPYKGPGNPKTKGTERNKSEGANKSLYAAVATRGQLGRDTVAQVNKKATLLLKLD